MGSWKIERELASGELPGFLRELAQALETGAVGGDFQGLPVDELRKLVLVAERRDKGFTLKLKAKRAHEVRVPTRPGGKAGTKPEAKPEAKIHRQEPRPAAKGTAQATREKYRQLKKSMQADFKAMQALAGEGRLPGADVLESFLSLAELMAQGEQPVAGAVLAELNPANAAFLADCQTLRQAFTARDAKALAVALERLARRKSACHAQFR
jgi:XXXCH domain-containing protein